MDLFLHHAEGCDDVSRAELIPGITELDRAEIAVPKDRLREVDPIAIGSIVKSIEEHGQLSPLIVRQVPGGKPPRHQSFELIDGAHRMAALKLLKIERIAVRCYRGPAAVRSPGALGRVAHLQHG